MSQLCGCYYHVPATSYKTQHNRLYLPLLESDAHSTILSTSSRTILKQTFKNHLSEAIPECSYVFPLYDGVSVVDFTCHIGSKILRGRVKEKATAKQIFDQAVARGESAGLLEQSADASDVFTTKLGNIPAGESVVVEITYVGELKHQDSDDIRFTIPTHVAPRYGAAVDLAPLHGGIQMLDKGFKVTVDVTMPVGSPIKRIQSPSHPIAVSMGTVSTAVNAGPVMRKASSTLSLGSAVLDKDFVLVVEVKDIGTPRAILEKHPTIVDHRALMVTLVPKFSLPPSRPEIVLVADRSGSMAGNITTLVSAMKVLLKSMPVGIKFNICSFGSDVSFLWDKSQNYSKATLDHATAHLDSFAANMGGTETMNAVQAVVERRYSDLPLEIMLLTDGDIWQQQQLFTYVSDQVAHSQGNIRIFPLGIGNGVSHALIEGLARTGNGFAQSVQVGERLDTCVVRMLRGAISPHVTDYTLEVKYGDEDDGFEIIEKVTDGLKVLLNDVIENKTFVVENKTLVIENKTLPEERPEKRARISLFDSNIKPEEIEKVDLTGLNLPKIPPPKLLQAPHKIPTLFAFSRSVVYLLMSPETIQRNPTSVVLRGTSTHGRLELEIPVEVLAEPGKTIHQLAAKKAVQDLEDGRGWISGAKDEAGTTLEDRFPGNFQDLVRKEAVRLGEKFQIAGKWCSFVAVAANELEPSSQTPDSEFVDFDVDMQQSVPVQPMALYGPPQSAIHSPSACKSRGGISSGIFQGFASPLRQSQQLMLPNIVGHMDSRSRQVSSLGLYANNYTPPTSCSSVTPASHPGRGCLKSLPTFGNPAQTSQTAQNRQQRSEHDIRARSYHHSLPASPRSSNQRASLMQNCEIPSESSMLLNSETPSEIPSEFSAYLFGANPAPPGKSDTDIVLALIAAQDFEGFWDDGNDNNNNNNSLPLTAASAGEGGGEPGEGEPSISSLTGLTIPPDALKSNNNNNNKAVSRKVCVTLIVISFLEEKMPAERGVWGLVVEKARAWVRAEVAGELEDLERQARAFVLASSSSAYDNFDH